MKGRSQRTSQEWITRAAQQVVLAAGLLMLVGCGTSDAPPSSELLENIQNAISCPSPKIHRNSKDIPAVLFGNGAKVTIAMKDPMPMGRCVFISDPSDNLRFQGAADKTIYKGGRGAVVLDGKEVFVYHLTITDQQLTKRK